MLAKYSAKPSQAHIDFAKYIIKYLKGSKHLRITFSSAPNTTIEAFVKHLTHNDEVIAQTDAHCGPQDQN